MFLIECEKDHSDCVVDENDIIGDDTEDLIVGDVVFFYSNNKLYEGVIIMQSDDEDVLSVMMKERKQAFKKQTRSKPPSKRISTSNICDIKRKSVKKAVFSPSQSKKKSVGVAKKNEQQKKNRTKKVPELSSDDKKGVPKKTKSQKTEKKENDSIDVDESIEDDSPEKVQPKEQKKRMAIGEKDDRKRLKKILQQRNSLDLSPTPVIDASSSQKKSSSSTIPTTSTVSTVGHSPTKEELKQQLAKAKKLLQLKKKNFMLQNSPLSSNVSEESTSFIQKRDSGKKIVGEINYNSEDDDSEMDTAANHSSSVSSPIHEKRDEKSPELSDTDDDDDHMYGKNWKGEKMILLRNNVYCRKTIYDEMKSGSPLPTHVVRKLIDGVFKRTALVNRTITGQSARAQGQDRMKVKVLPINVSAKQAIIDFAIDYAKKMGIEQTKTQRELQNAMSQKLCEIKADLAKNQVD